MPQRWSAERTRRELIRLTHRQLDTATLYHDSSNILGRFVAFDAAYDVRYRFMKAGTKSWSP